MKKKKVWIVIIAVVVVLILAVILLGRPLYEQSKMSPLENGEVTPDVFAVNNSFVNSYLVKGDSGYIMVDAGNSEKQTAAAMQEMGITPEDVTAILLTHSDSDHTAAVAMCPNAQLYLPAQEVQLVDGTTKRNILGGNRLQHSYLTLEDGEMLEIDGRVVQCVATPGHTPGAMSYLVDDTYLFTGDSMSLQDGKAALFNSYFNMDDNVQAASMNRLASLQPQYVFTAHYGYSDKPGFAFSCWR